jgi:hypothetical protein
VYIVLRRCDSLEHNLLDVRAAGIAVAVDRHAEISPVALLLQENAEANETDQDGQYWHTGQDEVGFDWQKHQGEANMRLVLGGSLSGLVILVLNNI